MLNVELLEHVGTETDIVNAARVSYDSDADKHTPEQNKRLLKYLITHEHYSPLEMCWLKFRVSVPIAIARQWMRHRLFSYNEISRRYTSGGISFFIPDQFYYNDPTNKQASASELHPWLNVFAKTRTQEAYDHAYTAYKDLLDLGVSREQARFVLPMGMMTKFIAAGNLRSWLHFIELRDSPHAQVEIRDVAGRIRERIAYLYPNVVKYYFK